LPLLVGVVHSDPGGAQTLTFADVTASAGINSPHHGTFFGTGQAWGDANGDGIPDLYLTDNNGGNELWLGDGDGTFSLSPLNVQVALVSGASSGALFADLDNDGDQDLYVAQLGANVLFENLGAGQFANVTAASGTGDAGEGESATVGDYDGDGDLDLYVVNWWYLNDPDDPRKRDTLYRNDGGLVFTDVTAALLDETRTLGPGYAATFADLDNDGDADLYVVNDKVFGNVLWRNDGPGCAGWCFADVSVATGADRPVWGMGVASGDYDRDGDLDLYFSSIGEAVLLESQVAQGSFTYLDVSASAGVTVDAVSWGVVFFDADRDRWPDLYLAIDTTPISMPSRLFHNLGDGTFADVSTGSGADDAGRTYGVAACDYDRDGWVDLVVGNWNQGYRLYRNLGTAGGANHWLAIALEGAGPVNREAVGTRVYLTLTDGPELMEEVHSDSSLGAGNDLDLYFGLGAASVVSARVVWPDGTEALFADVPLDTRWTLRYPDLEVVFADGFESGGTAAWASATP